MSAPNVVGLITDSVLEQIRGEIDKAVSAAVRTAEAQARAHLDALIADAPHVIADGPPLVEPEDPKADARQRAGRTAFQGALATVFVAVLLAVAGAIGGDFDFTSGGDWKAVAGAALAAAVAAGTAFVQRLVSPPRATD